MRFMRWNRGLSVVVGLLFATLMVAGCSEADKGDITSTTQSTGVPDFIEPTGTIQGKIRDAVTLEPIVNALVSIGLATDRTDAQGQFVLLDVPATTDQTGLGNVVGFYNMSVDLRSVTSPVNMTSAATTPRYPELSYRNISVEYTSFAPAEETPVFGLIANADLNVGKLAANITGVVAGCATTASFLTPVGAGFTVNLVTAATLNENTGSGSPGRVVATVPTGALGDFAFNNIESLASFSIVAVDDPTNPTISNVGGLTPAPINITAPVDGETLVLSVQNSTAVHPCTLDVHGPSIVAVTPEPGSDQTAGPTTVSITFSEAVVQTPAASVDPSAEGPNLYDDIVVNTGGTKAGNVPYTLAWSVGFTQLDVTFTAGTSTYYNVLLPGITLATLVDVNGQPADNGICPTITSSDPWGTLTGAGVIGNGSSDCAVFFTTNGGATPGTPVVTITNSASLDQGTTVFTALYDWAPVSGAKDYDVYCRTNQVYLDTTSQLGEYIFNATVTSSAHSINWVTFVAAGNEHSFSYDCFVYGANSDNVYGTASNIVTANDAIGAVVLIVAPIALDTTIVLNFNEAINEINAENVANYTLTRSAAPPVVTINSATLTSPTQVTLNLSAGLTVDTFALLSVTGIGDISGNANQAGSFPF